MDAILKKKYTEFGIKWGLILGLILIVINSLPWFIGGENIFERAGSRWIWIISLGLLIVFLAVTALQARKLNNGYITSKAAFRTLVAFVVTYGALTLVSSTAIIFINQEKIDTQFEKVKEETYEKMEEKDMSEEQIEQSLKWMDWFKPGIISSIITALLKMGFNILFALAIAHIVKRDPPMDANVVEETT